jgi:hypothetical protein
MTFDQACDVAHHYGAALPTFADGAPAAQCWIDRIAMLPMAAQSLPMAARHTLLLRAIAEADRCAGIDDAPDGYYYPHAGEVRP